jgi:3-dehydroquinate dehydratase/shikimate dehydrogenase
VRSRSGRGVIVSTHLFGEPSNDIASRYAALRATGAEILKLAIEVSRLEQTLPLFELAKHVEPRQRHVLIAMGGAGVPTRVLAGRLGSQWTYGGDGVAPGQIPASRLLYDFRFRRVAADAALYGVVGNPILHSLSPAMHNAGFAALGLNAVYVPLEAKDADDFVRFAKGVGLNGASITAPFKVALMPHVDEIDPLARRVGAINTVMAQNGRWIGTNTDVDGFLTPLEKRIRLEGARVSVLGAGGAARAAAFALASRKAEVTICARRAGEAAAIARLVNGKTGEFPPPGSSWDVLVNATSGGTLADPANPIEGARLDGRVVFDLVYAPAETALLDAARKAGCQTIGGIEMLIAQAERQFELWTGQRPPVGLFEASSRRVLAEGPHEGSPQGAPRQTEKNAANHIRPVR